MQVSAHSPHIHSARHHQTRGVSKPAAPQTGASAPQSASQQPAATVKISQAAAQAYAAHRDADGDGK
jgi:hypothetical protein